MITKKQLEKRIKGHLINTHGFVEKDWPAPEITYAGSNTVNTDNFKQLRNRLNALIEHLGLEETYSPAVSVPSGIVFVKKQKPGKKA